MFPVFTALPPYPQRIGDPLNFGAEFPVFVAAQPAFVTQANAVRDYLNTLAFDPFDWGGLTGTNPTRETIMPFPVAPTLGDTGLEFVSEADNTLEALGMFIADANLVGGYIDALAADNPAAMIVPDELRPTVGTVPVSPLLTDSQAVFESKAFTFYGSLAAYAASLGGFADYMYERIAADEDWGSITDAPDIIEDWGTIA